MSAEDILLDQARMQLQHQESVLDTMRTQTTAVFAASGVVAALFGPRVLAMKHETVWGYLALAALVVGAVASVYVLTPKRMTFGEHLDRWWPWLKAAKAHNRDEALAVGLAQHLDDLCNRNQGVMDRIATGYLGLCVAFGFQIAFWVGGSVGSLASPVISLLPSGLHFGWLRCIFGLRLGFGLFWHELTLRPVATTAPGGSVR